MSDFPNKTFGSLRLRLNRGLARILYRFASTGLPRIAEGLRRAAARRATRSPQHASVWIDDFCGDLRFCCDLSEHMGSQIFFKGDYSGGQLTVLRQLLREDSVFVDVGANQGEFTLCAAGVIAPEKGGVHAFEPVSTVRERLERNVAANGFTHVTIHSVGLSDETADDVPIYGADVAFADGTQHDGLPTLFGIKGRSEQLQTIALRRLDEVLAGAEQVDVIKIDVEGAEWSVLKGAEATIARNRPAIIFEASEVTSRAAGYSVKVLIDWLTERQYNLWSIGNRGELCPAKDNVSFCNILAIPREGGELAERAGVCGR